MIRQALAAIMRHHHRLAGIAAIGIGLFCSPAAWAGREFREQPGEEIADNELLIRLRPGVRVDDILDLLPAAARASNLHGSRQNVRLHLPPGVARQLSARLARDPRIDYVEPNRIR